MSCLRVFVLAGGLLLAACGAGPSLNDTDTPPVVEAGPTTGPSRTAPAAHATIAPTADGATKADRSCPSEFTGAVSIQPHPRTSDYAFEIGAFLSAGGPQDLALELDYLTSLHSGEPQAGRTSIRQLDLDGDGALEVVVELLFIPLGTAMSGHVYVFGCRGGAYEGESVATFDFTASFADPGRNSSLGLRSTEDLTGDGLPELILSWVTAFEMDPVDGRTDYTRGFQIVGWDGQAVVDRLPPFGFGGEPVVTTANGDGSLRDTDGDGLAELILQGGGIARGTGSPLYRGRTETWGWDGRQFVMKCVTHGRGVYRFHAVEDGDAALLCGDFDAALDAYQKAIFDESLKPWLGDELGLVPVPEDERGLLGAYSRYRILLIHVANGTDDAAEVVYRSLADRHPPGATGHEYAELAETLWETYREVRDLGSACRKVLAEAQDLTSVADHYGYFSRLYATEDYLCPF